MVGDCNRWWARYPRRKPLDFHTLITYNKIGTNHKKVVKMKCQPIQKSQLYTYIYIKAGLHRGLWDLSFVWIHCTHLLSNVEWILLCNGIPTLSNYWNLNWYVSIIFRVFVVYFHQTKVGRKLVFSLVWEENFLTQQTERG